jgi:phenylalanyl-tRNA synthetase alpha chain
VKWLHRHELAVLETLRTARKLGLDELLEEAKIGKDEALWAIGNLSNAGFVTITKEEMDEFSLTPEGEEYAKRGLPEEALVKRLEKEKIHVSTLKKKEDQIGLIWAKKKGLVEIDNDYLKLTQKGREASEKGISEDTVLKELNEDKSSYAKYRGREEIEEFVKRGLIEKSSKTGIREVEITQRGILELAKERQTEPSEIDALDRNIIKSRSWSNGKFKSYNVDVPVEAKEAAVRHPLRMLIDEVRHAYLSLGFTEVSGPVIDSSFWVFDYLFVPQHHPARDMQDTFFLSRPSTLQIEDKNLVKRIKEEHERAWHNEWSEEIAMQAVPRTHMTSVTGRYMNEMINRIKKNPKEYELPIKIFSIGRVFRNENVTYKNLADFYQMDGIIIGRQLTLANLFDVLIKLYSLLGVKINFKPAYFPFVEPGVECYTEFKGKDLELFGAGMIRREITGMERKSINVLAWGPGVDRLMLLRNEKMEGVASMYNNSAGWLRDTKA